MARSRPVLPDKVRRVRRVNERRLIAEILHVLRSGLPVGGCA